MMKRHKRKLEITLVTDHGNREGVDHLVKMIVWSSWDAKKKKHVLRHFNLDVDRGGHTAVAAANAIHKSLQGLHLDGLDIEYSFICGDSGGGARVQKLHPELTEVGAMPDTSLFANCILHALNLSYESACKNGLGDQGMNKYTPFQMCYLAILMLKTVKKQADLDTLKSYYDITMTQLMQNDQYRGAAKSNFIQAFDDLMEVVDESGDDVTGDELADDLQIESLLLKLPTNIKEPNFGRWGTVSSVAKIVLEHWLPIYYMAQNICAIENNGCYLHTVATRLTELMSARADKNQDSPTHYTALQFLVGFGSYMYDGNLEWGKKNDPAFGVGS